MQTTPFSLSRWHVFALTFLSYAALHSMRMGYAQIKPEFRLAYQQSHFNLGLFDAAIYLSLGVGFLLRFKFETKRNLIRTFFIFISISSIAYLYIPISHLILGDRVRDSYLMKDVLPGLSLVLFGFCQFPAWPTLLTIINHHFDVKKEGSITGAWSACRDIGNMVGLILSGVLITSLRVRWEMLMLCAGTLNWSSALLVYLYIQDNQQSQPTKSLKQALLPATPTAKQPTQFQQFLAYSKIICTKQENRLYLVSLALLKSILYGFLMWMPTYLTTKNYSSYKSTVPIAFEIGAMIGSYTLGYFYNHLPHDPADSRSTLFNNLKIYSLFYSCLAVTTFFTIFYFFHLTIFIYFILSTLCGAFLGGCFNMLASNQVIALVKGDKENVNRLSTLSMAVGNLSVGVVQILIGVMLSLGGKSNNENMLFIILFVIGVVAVNVLYQLSQLRLQKQRRERSKLVEMHLISKS